MKVYTLERTQTLPIGLREAWDFFSTPLNLARITPKELGFKVLTDLEGQKMYPGQFIDYIVHPLFGIPLRWTTEITHVKDLEYFVDEQRNGPYAIWHHQHFFREVPQGVEMKDLLHYALPLGPLGQLAHTLLVRKKVNEIFDFRYNVLEEIFPQHSELIAV
ncbi:MAG: SRPBCC family protein [Bacteroidota bacterium]